MWDGLVVEWCRRDETNSRPSIWRQVWQDLATPRFFLFHVLLYKLSCLLQLDLQVSIHSCIFLPDIWSHLLKFRTRVLPNFSLAFKFLRASEGRWRVASIMILLLPLKILQVTKHFINPKLNRFSIPLFWLSFCLGNRYNSCTWEESLSRCFFCSLQHCHG